MLVLVGKGLSPEAVIFRSPDWKVLLQQLQQHMPDVVAPVKNALRRRHEYREDVAQLIRDKAGIPSGVTVGIPVGITAGLSNAGALAAREENKIFYGGDLATEATSGSGTENDPWIIENRHFGHCQLRLDNSGWTKFRNCLFQSGNNMEFYIQHSFIGNIIFENCEFADVLATGADAYVIRIDYAGEYRFSKCLFSGAPVNQAIGCISNNMVDNSTLKMLFEYCRIDETKAAWTTNADFFENVPSAKTINYELEIRHCEFNAPTGSQYIVTPQHPDVYTRLVLENNSVSGFKSFLKNAADDDSAEINDLIVRYNSITDTRHEAIRCGNIKGGEIAYNDFIHDTAGSNYRLVYLTWDSTRQGAVCEDVDVHHNKFTKKTGAATASNECLESAAGINVKFRWNWVTECPEDAYEHLYPQEGCTIEYCVADNCGVQVCDIWKVFDPDNYAAINSDNDNSTLPAAGTHIHHIYGDCGDWPVILSGANGVVVHDIYVDNSNSDPARGSVNIQLRDNVVPENIFVSGPLPTANQRAIAIAVINTSTGDDVAAQWVDENGNYLDI